MIVVRLLPLIFAALLFAAHVMRFNGFYPALLIPALLLTLFIRHYPVIYLWQFLLGLASIEWLRTTIELIRMRITLEAPFGRLLLIMSLVIFYNIFVIIYLRHKAFKAFYLMKNDVKAQ